MSELFLRHPDKLYIGGEWIEPSAKSRIDVLNSATEETFISVAEAKTEDVNRAVVSSRRAFNDGRWSDAAPSFKKETLHRLADLIAAQTYSSHADGCVQVADPGRPSRAWCAT